MFALSKIVAIALEFANVIIRKSMLDREHPDGIEAMLCLDLPNFVEDQHLLRVGYMSTREAVDLINTLSASGVDTASYAALITSESDLPGWLTAGIIDGRFACWLSGEIPGTVVEFIPGFLLRCPRQLYRQIDELLRSHDISLNRSSGLSADSSLEMLVCYRGQSLLKVEVIGDHNGSHIGLWGQRDFRRRAQAVEDIALSQEIKRLLIEHGAENP